LKVDQRALEGIDAKLRRADEHFRVLYEQMATWDTARPWRLVQEVQDHGHKHLWRLKILAPIPVMWAVILGEAIHDLRSALDQCVYWLSVDWSRRPLEGSAFPVYNAKAAFQRKSRRDPSGWARDGGMWKIRGVGPGPQAFIEALQPYPQRRAFYCHHIQAVHDLSNLDKHRLVHLWGLRFGDERLRWGRAVEQDCTIGIDRRIRHDGDIVFKAVCRVPHPQMRLGGQMAATLSMFGGRRRKGGRQSLWDIGLTIGDVVGKLTGSIGNQRDEINLKVWSEKTDLPP
jgi:hypothetical protein